MTDGWIGGCRVHGDTHARAQTRPSESSERSFRKKMSAFCMSAVASALPSAARLNATAAKAKTLSFRTSARTSPAASFVPVKTRAATAMQRGRGALVIVAGSKSIGCTLSGTRRKRARKSGFRARIASAQGRKVLKKRRAKGRKVLAPAGAVRGWNKEKK